MSEHTAISPRHYKFMSKIQVDMALKRNPDGLEVIDVINGCQLGYELGNALKYLLRAGKKNPATKTQDLEKAIWYIEHHIKMREGE